MTTRDRMLDLTGLETRPAQVWGAVRLVPLVRGEPVTDLRLHRQVYPEATPSVADLGGGRAYVSYIPHGFVAHWAEDGGQAVAYGTQLAAGGSSGASAAPAEQVRPVAAMRLRVHRRMARREAKDRLRFLPLHLALEGYLALHFGGPTIAWAEWSERALRQGLSPRVEQAYLGAQVVGLADALRVFEIHPGQCGVMVYLADALAAAFVLPHPGDYRALHQTLVEDLYGDVIHHYATLMPPVADFRARIRDTDVRTLADLRAAAAEQERSWADFHDDVMARGLLGEHYTWQRVHRLGRFTLSRFLPGFRRGEENHIGETITDENGRIMYLKTFRLSENQIRRGHLLSRLAANGWRIADTAAELAVTEAALGLRLEAAGFGHLLRKDILDGYRRAARGAAHA